MENKSFRTISGIFGLVASILFVVYIYQTAQTIVIALLYTSFALLAYSLVSYFLLFKTSSKVLKAVPFVYMGFGLALIYLVVMLSGGQNTFLYLTLTTGLIAAISYFYAMFSSGYEKSSRKMPLRTH